MEISLGYYLFVSVTFFIFCVVMLYMIPTITECWYRSHHSQSFFTNRHKEFVLTKVRLIRDPNLGSGDSKILQVHNLNDDKLLFTRLLSCLGGGALLGLAVLDVLAELRERIEPEFEVSYSKII